MRILLAEDDRMIGASLVRGLRDEGYAVDWVRDGTAVRGYLDLLGEHYVLVLLDWNLPGLDGLSVLKLVRALKTPVPVLMITARDALEDRIVGLDAGADDYLVKPFAMGELKARMRALLRRRSERAEGGLPLKTCGRLSLDPSTHQVRLDQEVIALTPREFSLLDALVDNPSTVLSRQRLEQRLYSCDVEISSNVVEVLVHSLRRKLGQKVIENVRGLGWRIGALD